ncbi:MAG: PLP-dependent aminotransferase family protein [Verrucomicrobiales bacterium]|nr:PLP-dependent aminotransferase family protein [Verrucomicrobiales bacterium]
MIGITSTPGAAGPERDDDLRYERVARCFRELIEHGTLRPGERLPSVRRCSEQQGVSVATVIQAYRCLENRGFLEARPQSGYYVSARRWAPPREPDKSAPSARPVRVSVSELAMEVIRSGRRSDLVKLGATLPNLEFYPVRQLNRTLAAAARRDPVGANLYEPPPGHLRLRQQVARRALEAGCSLTPDDIVITVGATEALSLALRAVASPGDTIAIESPCYFGILQMIESLGMRACEMPTFPREGICLDELRKRLRPCAIKACLFTPNFSNPLGSCMPDAKKEALVQLLSERGIPLIEDDIYGNLAFDGKRPKTAKSFDTEGWVVLCDSFTKTLSPGYRVGWLAPGRFRARVEHLKYVTTGASPTLPQMAVADFLQNGGYDHHLRRVRRAYARQMQEMSEAIGRHFPEGTRLTRPSGGMCLWVELPARTDSLELYRRALAEGISIAPGPLFSAKQRYRNFVRLSVAHPWTPRLEQAVMRLGQIAAAV